MNATVSATKRATTQTLNGERISSAIPGLTALPEARVRSRGLKRQVRGWAPQGDRWLSSADGDCGCDEAVAHAGDGLDELGIFGVVAEKMAELADGGVDAVLGVDEDFAGPEALGDLGAGDELALPGGEQDEQLHRLALDAQGIGRRGGVRNARSRAGSRRIQRQDRSLHWTRERAGDLLRAGSTNQCVRKSARFERGWRFT